MVATHAWHVARALGDVYNVGLAAAQQMLKVFVHVQKLSW